MMRMLRFNRPLTNIVKQQGNSGLYLLREEHPCSASAYQAGGSEISGAGYRRTGPHPNCRSSAQLNKKLVQQGPVAIALKSGNTFTLETCSSPQAFILCPTRLRSHTENASNSLGNSHSAGVVSITATTMAVTFPFLLCKGMPWGALKVVLLLSKRARLISLQALTPTAASSCSTKTLWLFLLVAKSTTLITLSPLLLALATHHRSLMTGTGTPTWRRRTASWVSLVKLCFMNGTRVASTRLGRLQQVQLRDPAVTNRYKHRSIIAGIEQ